MAVGGSISGVCVLFIVCMIIKMVKDRQNKKISLNEEKEDEES